MNNLGIMGEFLFNNTIPAIASGALGLVLLIAGTLVKRHFLMVGLKTECLRDASIPMVLRCCINEMLLGAVYAFSAILLTIWCLGGEEVLKVAISIGYLAIATSCIGSYLRMKQAVGQLGVGFYERNLLICVAVIVFGMFFVLCGVLTGAIHIYQLINDF